MPASLKNFCHMCGHLLNGLAKEILTEEGLLWTCLRCIPHVKQLATGIRDISTKYDEDRGTHC